jgi:hypothetical protein
VGLGGADGLRDPSVCTAGSAFPIVQKIQHLPDVFLCYVLYFCVHVVCHGKGHLLHAVGAGMSYANDNALYCEIHGEYDVPFDHCGGVPCHGAFVHNMFQVDDVMYGDNVVDDVEFDYVVHGDTVVLGSVVPAEYVVQPAYVVHGDNMTGDGEVQSDYVVLDDEFAVQIGSVILGDNVVLDDETVVQVDSVIHGDDVVRYDDVQCC